MTQRPADVRLTGVSIGLRVREPERKGLSSLRDAASSRGAPGAPHDDGSFARKFSWSGSSSTGVAHGGGTGGGTGGHIGGTGYRFFIGSDSSSSTSTTPVPMITDESFEKGHFLKQLLQLSLILYN